MCLKVFCVWVGIAVRFWFFSWVLPCFYFIFVACLFRSTSSVFTFIQISILYVLKKGTRNIRISNICVTFRPLQTILIPFNFSVSHTHTHTHGTPPIFVGKDAVRPQAYPIILGFHKWNAVIGLRGCRICAMSLPCDITIKIVYPNIGINFKHDITIARVWCTHIRTIIRSCFQMSSYMLTQQHFCCCFRAVVAFIPIFLYMDTYQTSTQTFRLNYQSITSSAFSLLEFI